MIDELEIINGWIYKVVVFWVLNTNSYWKIICSYD